MITKMSVKKELSTYLHDATEAEIRQFLAENLTVQQAALFDSHVWPDCAIELLSEFVTGEEGTESPE
jgi:hypothetical protein